MRIRIVVALAVVGALWATPALAQSEEGQFMDLPGMGTAESTVSQDGLPGTGAAADPAEPAQGAPDEGVDLPGTGTLPAAGPDGEEADPAPATETEPDAAPASQPTSAGDSLPRTGAMIGGFALLGVALVSGGRLLMEVVPRGA